MKLAGRREVKEILSRADIVVEIVDARNPLGTRSFEVEEAARRRGRKIVIALNKCDLIPRRVAEEWVERFKVEGFEAVALSARSRRSVSRFKKLLKAEAGDRKVRVAVVGLPKTGKSTLVNALRGRGSAPTSPYPGSAGYTKSIQLYRVDPQILLIDTPGVKPRGSDELENVVRGVAVENLVNPVAVAARLIQRALKFNPKSVEKAYRIREKNPYRILEAIADGRGWRFRDGELDVERAARTVIRDYHTGKLRFYIPPGGGWDGG